MPKNLLKKLDSKSLKICNPHQGLLGKNGSQRRGWGGGRDSNCTIYTPE